MADRSDIGDASLQGATGTRWQDRMVLQLPTLRRLRRTPQDADAVIDLSDGADEETDGGSGAAEGAAPELTDGSEADSDRTVPPDDTPAQRRTRRFSVLVGALTLRSGAGAGRSPAAAVVLAWLWLVGWVLAISLGIAATAGFIAGGPLLRPELIVDAWRLVHLMPISSQAGPVSLVPMLPAMAVLALVVHACDWLWTRLQGRGDWPGLPAAGVAALAAGYFATALLVATSPTPGTSEGPFTQGWVSLFALVAIGAGFVVARALARPRYPRLWLLLQAAATVATMLLAVSFVLVVVQLLLHWSQFWDGSVALLSSGAQPPSRFDAAALGAIQLGYLPNAVVWTASYLLGAGFVVGEGTIVSPFTVSLGTLPELPLAALLPTTPLRWPWIPLVAVAAGSVVAGAVIRNAGLTGRMRTRVAVGLAVALLAALGIGVLAAASNGGLGPGRLAMMGPQAPLTMVAALLVVGFGQVVWALFPTVLADIGPFVDHGRHTLRGRRPRVPRRRKRPMTEEPTAAPSIEG